MTKLPSNNDSSPAERRRLVRQSGGSYRDIALGEAGTVGGRWAMESKTKVVGSSPIAYPRQPETSPWGSDLVGPEPSLGYSIEEHPAVGEPHEIEKSLRETSGGEGVIQTAPSNGSPKSGDVEAPPGSHSLLGVETTSPPPQKRKRKR
jgi:hypothetical protein